MHKFSAEWHPPQDFTRPDWDWEAQLGGSMFKHSLEELVESMPDKYREPFLVISRDAKQVMEALGRGADAYGLIHADLYPENVLYKAGKAYPIDFEDCGYGYWMWDIAVALCQWAWGDDWERMRDAFWEGYTQIHYLLPAKTIVTEVRVPIIMQVPEGITPETKLADNNGQQSGDHADGSPGGAQRGECEQPEAHGMGNRNQRGGKSACKITDQGVQRFPA